MQTFFRNEYQSLQKQLEKGNNQSNQKGNESLYTRKQNNGMKVTQVQTVKSLSDTMIYAQALQQRLTPNSDFPAIPLTMTQTMVCRVDVNCVNPRLELGNTVSNDINTENTIQLNSNEIEHFVETVRIENHLEDEPTRRKSDDAAVELQQAQQRAEKAVLEAEKFRAAVETPGNYHGNGVIEGNGSFEMLDIGSGISGDDFFHLICHIEPSLIHKIEKGEFVELEKLLPKDRLGGKNEEGRLEWVQRDGGIGI